MSNQSRLVVLLAVVASPLIGCASPARGLEAGFRDPPHEARPHTWWHWMNGNVTRAGITADLEAMKRIGLGGAQIFNVLEGIPPGPAPFMSPQWRGLLQHAVAEADRLDLELCLHNCAGWSSSGGPWITPEHAMQMVVTSEQSVTGPGRWSAALPQPETRHDFYRDIAVLALPKSAGDGVRIPDFAAKAGYEARYGQEPQLAVFPPGAAVARDAIQDLTAHLAADGTLTWDVPAGAWTILRIGYTPTGAVNAPAPEAGRGLECDKLSRAGMDAHWAGMMTPILDDLGPLAGRTLNNCLIDSYEVGIQNWTPGLREEFRRRRGYDLLPFLPALTGRVVESGEQTERFLWDFRRTIADLFAECYYGRFAELCHENGLQASIEPYDGPFECLLVGRPADIPMGEFWVGGGESGSCKLAASVAHTYGQRIVGAEAFTAVPSRGRWQNHPYSLKALGDLMYCAGINRYIMHRYAHQPWLDLAPGMTMGQWGTHFERTTTWWEPGAAWIGYLSRCQYLLQQGTFAADVCFFAGEGAPASAPHVPSLKARGFDYDACNADVLLNRMRVHDGRLVVRDGPSYRLLVLPDSQFMTPELAGRLRDLIEQGAVVLGPKPAHCPSLSEFPQCDERVRRIAEEVWGDCDGVTVQERAFGRGRVLSGLTPVQALERLGVQPDCEFAASAGRPKMAWIHRTLGDADVYFVSNQKPYAQEVACSFRVAGRAPELWHADSGRIEMAPLWSSDGARTTVRIPFDPAGSVFVVFRRPAGPAAEHYAALSSPSSPTDEMHPPQIVIRAARYEAIDGAGGADVTAKVRELVEAGETSIPANNATFGDPTYMHVKRLHVEYTLNGRPQTRSADENGTLELCDPDPAASSGWRPDYRLARNAQGALELHALKPGAYALRGAAGGADRTLHAELPAPTELAGSWTVQFPPNLGAPPTITLPRLAPLSASSDPGVRYFSGTATYTCEFNVPAQWLADGRVLYLDLGRVEVLAQVQLNGVDLGVWWKPPFLADVSAAARPGRNTLTVRVTNLWVNRLIGDEQLPDDCEWNGVMLKAWPDWLVENRPRPSARVAFTTWRHYGRDSPIPESGLIGPVTLVSGQRLELD